MGAVLIGHSTTRVVTLCIAAFFLGSLLHVPLHLPESNHGLKITRVSDRKTLRQEVPTILGQQPRTMTPGSPDEIRNSWRDANQRFHADGNYSTFEELVEASGMLDAYPPVPHGESGHSFYTVQPMQLLSWYPRAYLFPKFLDQAKCDHVIRLAESRLAPSGLRLKKGDTAENFKDVRTSQGTFVSPRDDPDGVLKWIEEKIAVLSGIPPGHGESFNVLRYELGQHYDSHYDAFVEDLYGKQSNQRIATMLIYLTDVEEGGETSFLLEGNDGVNRKHSINYKSCETGIKYKPRAGDALLFWSLHPDGTLDEHSLHGGCPVIKGTKWTMTKWMRMKWGRWILLMTQTTK